MKTKVYLFFNGDNTLQPADKDWRGYLNPDEMKLAWACANSWKAQGWEVERMTVSPNNDHYWPTGPLASSPYPYNGFLFELLNIARRTSQRGIWFTTSDVINNYFYPPDVESSGYSPHRPFHRAPSALELSGLDHFIPCQGFTLAAGYITQWALNEYLEYLRRWNADPKRWACIGNAMPCDEYVLRRNEDSASVGVTIEKSSAMGAPNVSTPLTHYSRSALQWFPGPAETF